MRAIPSYFNANSDLKVVREVVQDKSKRGLNLILKSSIIDGNGKKITYTGDNSFVRIMEFIKAHNLKGRVKELNLSAE